MKRILYRFKIPNIADYRRNRLDQIIRGLCLCGALTTQRRNRDRLDAHRGLCDDSLTKRMTHHIRQESARTFQESQAKQTNDPAAVSRIIILLFTITNAGSCTISGIMSQSCTVSEQTTSWTSHTDAISWLSLGKETVTTKMPLTFTLIFD